MTSVYEKQRVGAKSGIFLQPSKMFVLYLDFKITSRKVEEKRTDLLYINEID